MLSCCTVLPDSKETECGVSNQEASPSIGKNTGIVLVPFCSWKCVTTAVSGGVDISKVPGCHLLWQMNSQGRSQKLLQGLVSCEPAAYLSVFNIFLTRWIMAISKGRKPDIFESYNSPKPSSTNIWDLQILLNVSLWVKLSWHFCSIWNKFGWFNLFWQFLCEELSSFNSKEFYYLNAWSYSLSERKTSFCKDLYLENSVDSYVFLLPTFPLSITFFIVIHSFLIYHRWGSLHHLIC